MFGLQIRLAEKLYPWLMCMKFRPDGDETLQKDKEIAKNKIHGTVTIPGVQTKHNKLQYPMA